jgi:ABC-2 type transport system permease protein
MRISRFFAGWLPIAVKETQATLMRPRLLIFVIILALAALGGTYGILAGSGGLGGVPTRIAYGFQYWPDLNSSRPAMEVFVASPTGIPLSGLAVNLVNLTAPIGSRLEYGILETRTTDTAGWARFEGLSGRYPGRELALVLPDEPNDAIASASTEVRPGMPIENRGHLVVRSVGLGGPAGKAILSLVFIDSTGSPAEGADVFIWQTSGPGPEQTPPGGWAPYLNGTTDGNGYHVGPEPLGPGFYIVRSAKGVLEGRGAFGVQEGGILPSEAGPDGVLAFSGVVFFPILLPILALSLAYDAIAREKTEGSLDTLLSKPVSREGVALGKLVGSFLSMAVPVLVFVLATVALIWIQSGQSPTGTFLAVFLGAALFLLLACDLIFLAASSVARNSSTALLMSILLFLLFAIFWNIVSYLVAGLFATPGSVLWFEVNSGMSIGSPVGVYQQLIGLPQLGGPVGALFGLGGGSSTLSGGWIVPILLAWVIGPMVLFFWAMRFLVTED